MQIVLIGGPQSTGSSLLRQILNRHEQINCLNETHLFSKEALYDDWKTARKSLFSQRRQGLKTSGWHIFTGFDISETDKKILRQVYVSKNFEEFSEFALLAVKQYSQEGVRIFMDKTPANIFTLKKALANHICQKGIITIRDPYDTVASLISRGKHLMDAVVLVKSAMSEMKSYIEDERIKFIKYEDLVALPEHEIRILCDFLAVDFEADMLIKSKNNQEADTKIKGWKYDEGEAIKAGSLGRFDKLNRKKQNLIIKAFNMISWKGSNQSVWQVMDHFGYDQKINDMNVRVSFSLHLMRKLVMNWFKNNPYHVFNNPITFSKNR